MLVSGPICEAGRNGGVDEKLESAVVPHHAASSRRLAAMTSRSVADSVRLKLNLKNLRRHDETITEIVESTSYVVLYRMGEDGSWVRRCGPCASTRRRAARARRGTGRVNGALG